MVDWRLAASLAKAVAGEEPARAAAPFTRVQAPAAEAAELVAAYTGLHARELPAAEAVSRAGWIDAALASMRGTLDPVVDRTPLLAPARLIVGTAIGAQVGLLSGLLAQRVLGQYDVALLEPDRPPRLLFVAPNLAKAAAALHADDEELLRWVALHEITHALQFGGVPWLRDHLAGRVRTLLDSSTLDFDPRSLLRMPDLGALVAAVRDGDLVRLLLPEPQRRAIDELQAAMAVVEGYAEHVMDAVGASLLPSLPRLRARLEDRRDSRPPLLRLIERLLGFDLKLRQYRDGKAFCDAVVAAGGVEALNHVWDGPEQLPTAAELKAPQAWLERTAA